MTAHEVKIARTWAVIDRPYSLPFCGYYSGSPGLLKSTVKRMLPWPNCGKPVANGSPGSRLDAVSSGGNRMSEFKKAMTDDWSNADDLANESRAELASPPCRKMTSKRLTLRPSWP